MLRPRRRSLIVKGRTELAAMKVAGRLAARCLEWIIQQVEPGMTTQKIDDLQMDFARRHHAVPAPLNYRGFPKSICTSVNEVICHGIPSAKQVLHDGDIVGIDVTLVLDGFHGDTATVAGSRSAGAPSATRASRGSRRARAMSPNDSSCLRN